MSVAGNTEKQKNNPTAVLNCSYESYLIFRILYL